ncbi:MAG TPA: ABC transporter ATP-binding protein [Burkholderiaceae bacterium]|nr:ABC transporter ATP-binding protein [Burkholderiaceae bacterium]
MAEPLLQASGLRAGYGETVIVEDLDLALAPATALAVLGRNGVGKTTLLATLMGLTTRHGGSVRFDGRDISALTPHARARAGLALVPQERQIFRSLSVEENLRVALQPGAWTLQRIYELFPRLAERRRNLGHQLSGGEQQMLAIGRALVGNPRLILLDEPFEGLAPVIVDSLVEVIQRLRAEAAMTLVLVEQHAELALELTDRALVLDRGRTVWEGASATLRAEPSRLAALIGLDAAA